MIRIYFAGGLRRECLSAAAAEIDAPEAGEIRGLRQVLADPSPPSPEPGLSQYIGARWLATIGKFRRTGTIGLRGTLRIPVPLVELLPGTRRKSKASNMKGPGLRADLDVRRLWKCPRCSRVMRYSGDVVSHICHCQKEGTFMQLVEVPKPPVPTSDCREVRGSGAIAETLAPSSEADFGAGIAPESVVADDSSQGRPPESTATEDVSPA